MKTLGQKIREWRMKKGITQTELAEGLVTPSMISQIESDKANPSFKLLEGISQKLDVQIDEFLLDMQDALDHDTRYKLAKSMVGSGQYEKAVQVLESMLQTPEADVEVKIDLAIAYVQAGEFDKAIKLLEGMLDEVALDRDRTYPVRLLRQLGWTKLKQNDYVLAKHYLSQALKELAKSNDVSADVQGALFQNYAFALVGLGEIGEALEYYKKAISVSRGNSNLFFVGSIYMGLARAQAKLGEYQSASETIRTAITMFRSVNEQVLELQAKLNYGTYQYELQNYEESLQTLEECREAFEELGNKEYIANVYGEFGIVNYLQGNHDEAEEWCIRALELLPANHQDRAYVYRTLGTMYEKLQNKERALEYLLRSVDIFENFGLIAEVSKCYALISGIYQSLGELDKASEYMHKMTSSMQEGLRVRGLYL